jgi:hypothetical protein
MHCDQGGKQNSVQLVFYSKYQEDEHITRMIWAVASMVKNKKYIQNLSWEI